MNKLVDVTNVRALLIAALCLLCSTPHFRASAADELLTQGTTVVKGTVKDEAGAPVVGATVTVVDTFTGAITGADGSFTINVSGAEPVLEISFLGYETQRVPVGGRTNIGVVLVEVANVFEDIVVVGYGSQSKVTVTGAIASVSGSELARSPVASVANALTGKVSGFSSVQYSGEPGGDDPDIFVRGIGSLTTSASTPLVLVDGVERSFYQIDPQEIESISILKDASATAVFGVRGANGVILVTTRRGTPGRTQVSASTSFAVQIPTRMRKMANAKEYIAFYNEGLRRDLPNEDPATIINDTKYRFNQDIVDAYNDPNRNTILYPDTDWLDYLLRNATTQSQHNINVSGGTEKVRFFTSMGMLTQQGLFKTFDTDNNSDFSYKRYNFRANLDVDLTKTTLINVGLGGRIEDKNVPNTDEEVEQLFRKLYWATPIAGAGIVDGKWITTNNETIDKAGLDPLSVYYGRGYKRRIKNVLEMDLGVEQKLDFITPGLKFRIKGAYNSDYTQIKNFQGGSNKSSVPYYYPILKDDGTVALRRVGDDVQLGYSESFEAGRNWYFETGLEYSHSFGDHNVGALLLYNESKYYYPKQWTDIPSGYVGLAGRLTYDYAHKYMLDFNIGYNGSENFHQDRRFGVFPAFSAGWLISEEDFMKNQNVLSYLKIRGSYGVVGNDKLGDARFLYLPDSYSLGGGYYFGTNDVWYSGASEGQMGNRMVTWEKAYKTNAGLDIYFLNDKLKFNADFFFDKRKNILLEPNNIPGIWGMSSVSKMNWGRVENKGMEFTLEWNSRIGENFNYWINANMSYARNKIIEQDEITRNEPYMQRTGHSVGQFFGRKMYGFYYDGIEDQYKRDTGYDLPDHGFALQPGDVVYYDLNQDGIIDGDDVTKIGYSEQPRIVGGLTVGFSYKGFDFQMLWSGAGQASRMLTESLKQALGDTGDKGLMQYQYDKRWTEDNPNGGLPRATIGLGGSSRNNYQDSDLWLKDARYLRLKNIEFGYTFGFDKYISNLRIYVSGYNLLTFDKLKDYDIDPEAWTNTDRYRYPLMKVINLGLKIGF